MGLTKNNVEVYVRLDFKDRQENVAFGLDLIDFEKVSFLDVDLKDVFNDIKQSIQEQLAEFVQTIENNQVQEKRNVRD